MDVKITFDRYNVIEADKINDVKVVMVKGEKGDVGYPTDAQVETAVDEWLTAHPEVTTTVQDGSITEAKLANDVKGMFDEKADAIIKTSSGDIASFTDGGNGLLVKSLIANITPKQSGSGDPSPSNVRPISGTDTVNVTVSNLNYIDESTNESGAIDANGNNTTNASFNRTQLIPIKNGIDATFKVFSAPASSNIRIHGYSANGSWLRQLALVYTTGSDMTQAITIGDDVYYIRISYPTNALGMVLLCQGTAPSTMITHQGDTYTTSLGQTVYGGTLDVVSGKLVSDMATPIDLGSLEWRRDSNSGTYYFYATLSTPCAYAYNTPESQLKVTALPYSYKGTSGWAYMGNKTYGFTYNTIRIRDDSYTDPTSFKASLTNVTFSYGVATPIEVTLTPTQVNTLLGQNNIFADSGSVEVEYRADTTLAYNELLSLIASLS